MNGIIGHDSALAILGRGQPGLQMNLGMNHVPGAGLKAKPIDLGSRKLPLCYDYPIHNIYKTFI